jgi:ACR3 family arsenite efflux pump ArsB
MQEIMNGLLIQQLEGLCGTLVTHRYSIIFLQLIRLSCLICRQIKTIAAKGKFVAVSIPIAIGLLVMMYPILCKVKYETLHHLFKKRALWIQIGFSIIMNWIIAPFLTVRSPIQHLYQ